MGNGRLVQLQKMNSGEYRYLVKEVDRERLWRYELLIAGTLSSRDPGRVILPCYTWISRLEMLSKDFTM